MTNFNGFIYTWEDGHLVGSTGGGKAAAYVYNASGIRTMKVLNGKVTNYTLTETLLIPKQQALQL